MSVIDLSKIVLIFFLELYLNIVSIKVRQGMLPESDQLLFSGNAVKKVEGI